jgi:hypothetical protein
MEWGDVDERLMREAEMIVSLATSLRYGADRRMAALYADNTAVILEENQRLRGLAHNIIRLLGGESDTEPGIG